jgi:hypothetical protein
VSIQLRITLNWLLLQNVFVIILIMIIKIDFRNFVSKMCLSSPGRRSTVLGFRSGHDRRLVLDGDGANVTQAGTHRRHSSLFGTHFEFNIKRCCMIRKSRA